MIAYLTLPFVLIKFWFIDAPLSIAAYFASLNGAFLHFFSLRILLQTFFKPLKNEYREGLVLFSRLSGMAVKTIFIFVTLLLLLILVVVELILILAFVSMPLAASYLLLGNIFVNCQLSIVNCSRARFYVHRTTCCYCGTYCHWCYCRHHTFYLSSRHK